MRKYLTFWVTLIPTLLLLLLPTGVFAGTPPTPGTFEDCVAAFNAAYLDFNANENVNLPVTITASSCNRIKGDVILFRDWEADGNSNANSFTATADKPGFCRGSDDDGVGTPFNIEISKKNLAKYKKFLRGPGCKLIMQMDKIVFRTSLTFTGDLVSEAATLGLGDFTADGLGAGDAICNDLAGDEGLPGTYTFWGSDSGTDAINRVTNSLVPYVLVDGTVVAADRADVLNCGNPTYLLSRIDLDENGTLRANSFFDRAWTGTNPAGVSDGMFPNSCNGWTSQSGAGGVLNTAVFGNAASTTSAWTFSGVEGCNNIRRLICFQD